MKKIDNLFDQLCSFQNLHVAYQQAKRGKKNHNAVKRFNYNLEKNLFKIGHQLKNFEYSFGPYNSFKIIVPKLRVVEAATFTDKVVHYAIYNLLNDFFEKKFISTTFACIKGRGNHNAMLKMAEYVNSNRNKEDYYFQGDIKKYFATIDRKILIRLLGNAINDEQFMRIAESLIMSAPGERGLPIGNLTSQLFANIYLNELDQFVKRGLQVKKYVRYMDDFVLVAHSKEEARELKDNVNFFLKEHLMLELAPHKVHINLLDNGISFVGYKILPGNIRIRGSSLRRFRKKLKAKFGEARAKGLASFLGHASYCTDYIHLGQMLSQAS